MTKTESLKEKLLFKELIICLDNFLGKEENESISDEEVVAGILSFVTFVIASSELEIEDILQFIDEEMPEKIQSCREGMMEGQKNV